MAYSLPLTAAPTDPYKRKFDYDVDGNLIYEGWARSGAATSDAAWAIRKYTYSVGKIVTIEWGGGDLQLSRVWDDRTTVTYA